MYVYAYQLFVISQMLAEMTSVYHVEVAPKLRLRNADARGVVGIGSDYSRGGCGNGI